MLREVFQEPEKIEIDHFEGLLVDYVKRRGVITIVRGLRAISDFEIEFQMALMNRKIEPRIETIFFVPPESYSYLSSKLVKEIYMLGGEVPSLVPESVDRMLKEKFRRR
jgi:pantetheine-phosphate adenylyltransferase